MKNINLEQKISNLGPAEAGPAEGMMNAQRAQKSQLGPLSIFMAATLFLRTVQLPSNGYFYYFQIYQQTLTASPYLFPQKREPLRKADWIDNPPYLEMISLNQKK